MNLHGIASGAISAVNPATQAVVMQNTGYTTAPDGTRSAAYNSTPAVVQVQSLTQADLKLIDGLGIQGQTASVYLAGQWSGILRADAKGGDKLQFNGQTWRVIAVPEQWPDWTRLIVCLQR